MREFARIVRSIVNFRTCREWKAALRTDVTAVGNGRECLEALSHGFFDLLLLDVQMPEMDGFEAVRKIREMEKDTGNRLLAFGLTAHVMKGDRERCLAAGMDDYLTKPIHAQRLYEAIERHSVAISAYSIEIPPPLAT